MSDRESGYTGGELDPDEYRHAEDIGREPAEYYPERHAPAIKQREKRPKRKLISPQAKAKIIENLEYTGAFVAGIAYASAPLWLILGAGLIFVDQSKKDDLHPNQLFKLPPTATEVRKQPEDQRAIRQFAVVADEASKIACPPSFVRKGDITLTKPILPVHRSQENIGEGHIIFTREAVSSNTMPDTVVTCTYPQSEPKEIMRIPKAWEGK